MNKLRRVWWRYVRGYLYELCQRCGRPVSTFVRDREPQDYWRAPDRVWLAVYGTDAGIRCPGCFVADAAAAGRSVSWRAVVESRDLVTTKETSEGGPWNFNEREEGLLR